MIISDISEDPNRCYIDSKAPRKRKSNQPNHIYHAEEEHLSSSALKKLLRSPRHWLYGKENPQAQTPAMIIGSAFHTALLEPDKFDKEFVVVPGFNNRTNEGKAQRAEWEKKNQGKTFISQAEIDKIGEMKKSLLLNPTVLELLSSGHAEHSFYTHLQTQLTGDVDEWTPIKVKVRPDFLKKDWAMISIKTAKDASPQAFARDCVKFHYALSEAFYLDVLSQFAKRQLRTCYMIVVEKDPPFAHAIYKLDQEFIAEGRHQYRKALKKYLYCLRSEQWPGYEIDSENPDGVLGLKLPGYGYDNLLFTKTFKEF